MSRLLGFVCVFSCATAHAQFNQLERPADISTWIEVTITPEYTDETQFVRIGPIPNTYVQTSVFWMPYEQGGFNMFHERLDTRVSSKPVLGVEIAAGVQAVTITRLGDIYAPFQNTALQDFRYASAAGVRDATEAVAFRPVPKPSTLGLIAPAAMGLGVLRRPR